MPALELEFEVFCANCGDGLCNTVSEGKTKGRGMPFINLPPCQKCMSAEFEKGKDKGYDEGYETAQSEMEKT